MPPHEAKKNPTMPIYLVNEAKKSILSLGRASSWTGFLEAGKTYDARSETLGDVTKLSRGYRWRGYSRLLYWLKHNGPAVVMSRYLWEGIVGEEASWGGSFCPPGWECRAVSRATGSPRGWQLAADGPTDLEKLGDVAEEIG